MTKGGSCAEDGDYLAWGDMEWILHGPVQFSAGIVNHIYGVYHCVVSNSSFSG